MAARRPRGGDVGTAPARWAALDVLVPACLGDALFARVAADCLGIAELEASGSRRRYRIYWDSPAAARSAESELRAALDECGADVEIRVCRIDDGRWVERYQARLQPFPLGRRFVVHPAGPVEAAGHRIPVHLVPGRAFGTGEHPTTRLCAEALEEWVSEGDRWVDIGTGSGILAVVAARCGARLVRAVDVDPIAIEVASEVVRANDVDDKIEMRLGSIEVAESPPSGGGWNGVVSNLETPFFLSSAARIAALIGRGGVAILSGIPEPESGVVEDRFVERGLETVGRDSREGWSALVLRLGGTEAG